MASRIAEAFVEVSARTDKLRKGLATAVKSTETATGKMVKSIGKVTMAMGKMALAAGAAAAAIGGVVLRNLVNTADTLDKTSKRLGITVERLQELRFAAGQAGVGVNALEMGLQRMTRRVAEAAQGGGEAIGALDELGLDPTVLARMSPDQQLREIGRALGEVSSQSDKVRLAFKLFDSEGVALLQLIGQGTGELDRLSGQVQEFGTLNEESVMSLVRLKDAWGEVLAAAKGAIAEFTNSDMGKATIDAATNSANRLKEALAGVADILQSTEEARIQRQLTALEAADNPLFKFIRNSPQGIFAQKLFGLDIGGDIEARRQQLTDQLRDVQTRNIKAEENARRQGRGVGQGEAGTNRFPLSPRNDDRGQSFLTPGFFKEQAEAQKRLQREQQKALQGQTAAARERLTGLSAALGSLPQAGGDVRSSVQSATGTFTTGQNNRVTTLVEQIRQQITEQIRLTRDVIRELQEQTQALKDNPTAGAFS
jgi:hypothetical protein